MFNRLRNGGYETEAKPGNRHPPLNLNNTQEDTTMSVNEISTKAREYKELQNFIKTLQDEADALKAAITAAMDEQGTDTVKTDLFTIRWTAYQSTRVDTTALKNELPEIAARYSKTTTSRRFAVA